MKRIFNWLWMHTWGRIGYWWKIGRKSDEQREFIIKDLTESKDPSAVNWLILALFYGGDETRLNAATELAWTEDKRAVFPLIHSLEDEDWRVGEASRAALVQIGEEAIEPLRKVLWGRHWGLRIAAANVLCEMNYPRVMEIMQQALQKHLDPDIRAIAAKYLGTSQGEKGVDPQLFETLVKGLRDSSTRVRSAISKALATLGDVAVEELAVALWDPDQSVRKAAVIALGGISTGRAAEALLGAINDTDKEVREYVESALIKMGALVVEPLSALIKHEDRRVRETVIKVLSEIKSTESREALIKALEDDIPLVRCYAAMALGNIKSPESVDALIRTLEDEDASVRCYAAAALGEIGSYAIDPLLSVLKQENTQIRKAVIEALGEIKDPVLIAPLMGFLKDHDLGLAAATALGMIKTHDTVLVLLESIKKGVQDNALYHTCEALAMLGTVALDPVLETLKTTNNKQVKKVLISVLGQIKDPKGIEDLILFLDEKDEEIRLAAAEALGEMGQEAMEPLIKVLNHKNWWVREEAAYALGVIKNKSSVDGLVSLLFDKEPNVRKASAQALGVIKDQRPIQSLMRALLDQNKDIRWYAAEALGAIGDVDLITPLEDRLSKEEDPDIRKSLEAAILSLRERSARK